MTRENRKLVEELRKIAERSLGVIIERWAVRDGATIEKHECSSQWWTVMTFGRRAEDPRVFLGPLGIPLAGNLLELRVTFARERVVRYTTVTLLVGDEITSLVVTATMCRGKRRKDEWSEVIGRRWAVRLPKRLLAWIAEQGEEGERQRFETIDTMLMRVADDD